MSNGDERALESAQQRKVRALMAKLGPQMTKKLVEAAGPNPRTGSSALTKLVEDALTDLTTKVATAAGPNPRTG